MTDASLRKEEESTFDTEDREQPIPPENVVAYNELRSCADLHRMYVSGKLEIQPDFQREVVWKRADQTRFIDSLVKQLPIPSMCFSLDVKTQRWKVIDGLQRMHTITSFLGEAMFDLADLDDIHPILRGKRNTTLRAGSDVEKRLYSSVEDISVPITVIRCDYERESHTRYLFTIFHRLNSGGVRLNNQEIRNCIYSGPFNDALKQFDRANGDWKNVKRRIWGKTDRFRSVEVLLRVLAFCNWLDRYDGNLARFLNDYMHSQSTRETQDLALLKDQLSFMAECAEGVLREIGGGKKSLVIVEGILVGIFQNRDDLRALDNGLRAFLAARANEFVQLPQFSSGARYALSSPNTVRERLQAAEQLFSL